MLAGKLIYMVHISWATCSLSTGVLLAQNKVQNKTIVLKLHLFSATCRELSSKQNHCEKLHPYYARNYKKNSA